MMRGMGGRLWTRSTIEGTRGSCETAARFDGQTAHVGCNPNPFVLLALARASPDPLLLRVARGERRARAGVADAAGRAAHARVPRAVPRTRRSAALGDGRARGQISLQPWRAYGRRRDPLLRHPHAAAGARRRVPHRRRDGPVVEPPLRSRAQVDRLRACRPTRRSASSARRSRAAARRSARAAVVGFVGGPLTLAAYAVEGAARAGPTSRLRAWRTTTPARCARCSRGSPTGSRATRRGRSRGRAVVMVFETARRAQRGPVRRVGSRTSAVVDEVRLPDDAGRALRARRRRRRAWPRRARRCSRSITVGLAGAARGRRAPRAAGTSTPPCCSRDATRSSAPSRMPRGRRRSGAAHLNLGHGAPRAPGETCGRSWRPRKGGRARPSSIEEQGANSRTGSGCHRPSRGARRAGLIPRARGRPPRESATRASSRGPPTGRARLRGRACAATRGSRRATSAARRRRAAEPIASARRRAARGRDAGRGALVVVVGAVVVVAFVGSEVVSSSLRPR